MAQRALMAKVKVHHEQDIHYCQSRDHRIAYAFGNGEKAYKVKRRKESGMYSSLILIELVVCTHCHEKDTDDFDQEITIQRIIPKEDDHA